MIARWCVVTTALRARRERASGKEKEKERECAREKEPERVRERGKKVHWPSFASSVAVSKEHEVMNLPPRRRRSSTIPAMGDARAFPLFVSYK